MTDTATPKPRRSRKKAAEPPPMFDQGKLDETAAKLQSTFGVDATQAIEAAKKTLTEIDTPLAQALTTLPEPTTTPPEQAGTKETNVTTATATLPAPPADTPKKKTAAPPMERILRLLDQQIKAMEDRTDLPEQDRFQIVDGLKGLKSLVNTRDQIAQASTPPAPGTAWALVIAMGRRKPVF